MMKNGYAAGSLWWMVFWLFWVLSVFALAQLIGFAANELITSFYRLSLSVMVHHTLFAPHPCRLTLLTRVFSASLPFPFMIIIIIIRAFRFSAPCLCSNEWSLSCNKQLWSSVYIISNKYVFPSLTMIKHSKKKVGSGRQKKNREKCRGASKSFSSSLEQLFLFPRRDAKHFKRSATYKGLLEMNFSQVQFFFVARAPWIHILGLFCALAGG